MTVKQQERDQAPQGTAPGAGAARDTDEPLALQPGHVMQREHYERLAREATQK